MSDAVARAREILRQREAEAARRSRISPGMVATLTLAGLGLTIVLLAALVWDPVKTRRVAGLPRNAAFEARATQWVELSFEDARATLDHEMKIRLGIAARPSVVRHFGGATHSPCAGIEDASGPFYCLRDRTAAFDIRFILDLSNRLRDDLDQGLALMAGQIAAMHAQAEMGLLRGLDVRSEVGDIGRWYRSGAPNAAALAVHADCLAGVWAVQAAGQLGEISSGVYARLISLERSVMNDRDVAPEVFAAGYDLMGAGTLTARRVAFETGLRAGDITACPRPRIG